MHHFPLNTKTMLCCRGNGLVWKCFSPNISKSLKHQRTFGCLVTFYDANLGDEKTRFWIAGLGHINCITPLWTPGMQPHKRKQQKEMRKGSNLLIRKTFSQWVERFRKSKSYALRSSSTWLQFHPQATKSERNQRKHVAMSLIHQLLPLIAASWGEVKENRQWLPGCGWLALCQDDIYSEL